MRKIGQMFPQVAFLIIACGLRYLQGTRSSFLVKPAIWKKVLMPLIPADRIPRSAELPVNGKHSFQMIWFLIVLLNLTW